MRTLLNLLWLVLSGLWLAIGYLVAGVVLCLLIITIPFGVACFRLAAFVAVALRAGRCAEAGGRRALGGGQCPLVPPGRAVDGPRHLVLGVVLCLTIIGIPLGLGNFKLAALAIARWARKSSRRPTRARRSAPSSSE